MSDNTLLFVLILGRMIACCLSVAGAVYLAYHGKDGWGWLIFLALVLGGISVSTKGQT
jgi:ABC-type phosphate transport system permease subunit